MVLKVKFFMRLLAVLALAGSMGTASAALTVNPAQTIIETVTVQPIVVSDDDGANTAEFFGNAGQQASIETLIDVIWAQAGIDVIFLTANAYDDTFANQGTSPPGSTFTRPTSDLSTIVNDDNTAGVTHANPNVINMFFVNVAAGFSLLSENTVAGLAFLGGNGITQYVGSNLLTFPAGIDAIAHVVAHEISHNLGLGHNSINFNLMQSGGSSDNRGERLNTTQITTALASNFSVVPVPPAIFLMLTGMGLLGLLGRKKRFT
jgi:hypothetical protein